MTRGPPLAARSLWPCEAMSRLQASDGMVRGNRAGPGVPRQGPVVQGKAGGRRGVEGEGTELDPKRPKDCGPGAGQPGGRVCIDRGWGGCQLAAPLPPASPGPA